MLDYCRVLGPLYDDVWASRARLTTRKLNFVMYGKRQAFLDMVVNQLREKFGSNITIAFGAAGPFSRLRGKFPSIS